MDLKETLRETRFYILYAHILYGEKHDGASLRRDRLLPPATRKVETDLKVFAVPKLKNKIILKLYTHTYIYMPGSILCFVRHLFLFFFFFSLGSVK